VILGSGEIKSIVMAYRLDGQDSIPDMGKIFHIFISSRPALGPTQLPIQWILETFSSDSFYGVKLQPLFTEFVAQVRWKEYIM
jgi:hypothetical protein